ncbi:MAG TPA: hypothetical protein VKA15_09935 [Isosphaeraceae bacterium]|nr:hypothetical protein [Isosphaeraceae bacterium]
MRYLLALLLPPIGMLLCGKVFQAILCVLLMVTVIGWPVASIWALFVVHSHLADKRMDRLVRALRNQ